LCKLAILTSVTDYRLKFSHYY